jgi:hypothetical protein
MTTEFKPPVAFIDRLNVIERQPWVPWQNAGGVWGDKQLFELYCTTCGDLLFCSVTDFSSLLFELDPDNNTSQLLALAWRGHAKKHPACVKTVYVAFTWRKVDNILQGSRN